MLAAKAPHPNCAYMWMQYISTPKVQAEQAVTYGETPANLWPARYMDQLQAGSCADYHANAPTCYLDSIRFWKTPLATCDNGKNDCVPYTQWVSAWTPGHGLTSSDRQRMAPARVASGLRSRRPSGSGRGRGHPLLSLPLAWFVVSIAVPRGPPDHGVLAGRPVYLQPRADLVAGATSGDLHNAHICTSSADGRIAGGDDYRPIVALPFAYYMARVAAPRARTALYCDLTAAVGQLPGAGLRLDRDLHNGGFLDWTLAKSVSAPRIWSTPNGALFSSSATSGCRT